MKRIFQRDIENPAIPNLLSAKQHHSYKHRKQSANSYWRFEGSLYHYLRGQAVFLGCLTLKMKTLQTFGMLVNLPVGTG